MPPSRTFKMKTTNLCLSAGGRGETPRHSETGAGRLRHWEERTWTLANVTAGFFRVYEIKIEGAYAVCAKIHAQGGVLPLSSSFLYASGFPLHISAKEDPQQCEFCTKCTFSLQRTAFTGSSVGAKDEKCRTPSEHQVSVEIAPASSQGFLCH